MAYKYFARKSNPKYRALVRSAKRGGSRRRYRRPTRRTKRKSGGMSKKRILNVSSTKKRDTMLCYTNSTAANQGGGTTYSNSAAIVTGGQADTTAAAFLWCSTGRDNFSNAPANQKGTKFDSATRTSTSPYMVGLSEKLEIQCNTGMPWQWRRVCFTMKGPSLAPNSTASGYQFSNVLETSNGIVRVMNQVTGNPGSGAMYGLMLVLFKGQVNSDWIDPMTAPTDNSRVTIKYDKTMMMSSGNEDGFIRSCKRWHPMKKTLVYDDDENGGSEQASAFSSEGRAGMGDYYVLDLFRARQGSATSDQLSIRPTSTLYWHEK